MFFVSKASYKGIAKLKRKVSFGYGLTFRTLFLQPIPGLESQFVDSFEQQKTCEIWDIWHLIVGGIALWLIVAQLACMCYDRFKYRPVDTFLSR